MTNQRAIILLSQMYLPCFDEEEKEAITKAIEALTDKDKSHKYGDCDKCANTYGTLGCCSTVNNEWIYSCEDGMKRYKIQQAYNKGFANGRLAAQEQRLVAEVDFDGADEYGYLPVWVEYKDDSEIICDCITKTAITDLDEDYCRYWTSRPVKEQREAIPWE